MEYHGIKGLFNAYRSEVVDTDVKPLSKSYFYQTWLRTMEEGVVDPSTGTYYTTHVRKNSARGFAQCDTCSGLNADICAAKTEEERDCYLRQLAQHRKEVKDDRNALARVARLCKINPRHVGFMIDAVDKHKFGIPTMERNSKSTSGMFKITHKYTGVQMFRDDSLLLFSTLPDVPLGGNLTLTIIAELFKREDVQRATHLYINLDGASDNICYHLLYGLAHLMRCAKKTGWPLTEIYILRFKVCAHAIYSRTCVCTNFLAC